MLQRYSTLAYCLMRIVVGLLFACHGAQKLLGAFGGPSELHDLEGFTAGIIELVGGSLISLGIFTPVAAFLASGEMAAGYLKKPAPPGFWCPLYPREIEPHYRLFFFFLSSPKDYPLSLRA